MKKRRPSIPKREARAGSVFVSVEMIALEIYDTGSVLNVQFLRLGIAMFAPKIQC